MSDARIRPDVQTYLDILNQTPLARLEELGAVPARELMDQIRRTRPSPAHALAIVRDLHCPGPAGPIALRFYDRQQTREPGPIFIYFHGGGFVLGGLESHHQICIDVATQVDAPVVSVDYRLAPESPFPAAFDDAQAAARWVAREGAAVLDRQPTSIVLAGDSAGANLAAATAAALCKSPADLPVAAQFLIYPTTGRGRATASKVEFAQGYFLSKPAIDWFDACYAAPLDDSRFDLLATDLPAMPPTLVVTAGLDPLRDEGRAYASALIEAGVAVTFQEAKGNIHGFFGAASVIPSSAADVENALGALRHMIRNS